MCKLTALSWEVGPLFASLAFRSRFCCAFAPLPMMKVVLEYGARYRVR